MSLLSYASGPWYCLVRTETVVLLPPETGRDMVNTVWEALAHGSGVERVLSVLSGDFSNGWSAVPPFAVVSYTGGLHVLLRGAVQLTANAGTIQANVSGQGVSTWSERVLDPQDSWTLHLPGAASSTGEEPLPLVAGVVMASAVMAVSDADADADAEADADADAGEETIHPGLFTAAPAEEPAEVSDEEPAEVSNAVENTSGYDHLWDQTVMRRVEDAAVRPEDENETEDDDVEPAGERTDSEDNGAVEPEPDLVAGAPAASVAPAIAAPVAGLSTGLIDSVPWARRPESTPQESPSSRPPKDTGAVPTSDLLGDHDGETVMKRDLPTDQGDDASGHSAEQKESRPATGPTVLARLCPAGHANAPTVSICSICGRTVDGDTSQVRRPSLGRMRASTGEVYELDSSLIVGRQPSVSRVQGSVMPRLVQVTSESGDISRSHVEIRLEGWHVMLCDLRATNGTVLIRSGQPPRRLGEGEMAILLDGDVAQLGQDVSLRFEDLR
ncbi:FHA domain-containing protein [Arthrobacter roseus]|uniref:FHA domain-containing protein n=1 Tax=Arthrobacter roseus TaxID=136274 RepID=UPI001965F12B|nr:FHA domain-containing protein [Arthrobacter roseus]MBM7848078.1 hypothetical protein [Arthrobacter roseus]